MDYVYIYLIGLLGCTILFSIAHNMSDEEAVDSAVIVIMAIFWPVVLPFVVLNGLSRAIIKIGR